MSENALVLVLNAGSSSLKFCVYQTAAADWRLEARGQVEGIGRTPKFSAKDGEGRSIESRALDESVRDPREALEAVAAWLREHFRGATLAGVGHRVVHGGANYAAPIVVTPQVLADLRALVPLAPLHQPYNLAAIDAVSQRLPEVPQVACFDTGFHRGHRKVVDVVPLPPEIRQAGVQRYGFHGLSYEYIASALPQIAPEIARKRVIVAHLGSGASMCALHEGRSVDSTLGFTALDGLCMGTRPGALDPGVVLYLFQELGLSARAIETMLYKQSGLLGLSGVSNDMRDLLGNTSPDAQLAVEYFVYQAAKSIGALASVLGGVDALVFTAGIGEHAVEIRERICAASAWLGVELDRAANQANGPRISTGASRVAVWVVPTNEELMIARHTGQLLGMRSVNVKAS